MSNIYNLQPPTKGKVVLKTTMGDIDIEFWPKEAPKAVRNFVQLCMEGYYDGTVFHRVIKDYIIQGGDPTGTGEGGDTIYGVAFKDEFHSRLKFNQRGLLACANQNLPDTNGSQFFFTLARTEILDRKNTIFGKVTGDTIFNLLRMAELPVDENDRPLDPPTITEVEVLYAPFEDIVPRISAEQRRLEREEALRREAEAATRSKRPSKKNLALLSFGEEAEAEESHVATLPRRAARIKSAHDVLEDARLERGETRADDSDDEATAAKKQRVDAVKSVLTVKQPNKGAAPPSSAPANPRPQDDVDSEVDDEDFAAAMRKRAMRRRHKMGDAPPDRPPRPLQQPGLDIMAPDAAGPGTRDGDDGDDGGRDEGPGSSGGGSSSGGDDETALEARRRRMLEDMRTDNRKKTFGRVKTTEEVADADLLKPYQVMREKYKARKRLIGSREKATLARLADFTKALKSGTSRVGQRRVEVPDRDDEEGEEEAQRGGEKTRDEEKTKDEAPEKADQGAGYSGRVRQDIDHRAYMPAAWRVDDYLAQTADVDDSLESLRSHKLVFDKDRKDHMARSDNLDDYVVFDPLLEKGKGKFSKLAAKEKKRNTEWGQGKDQR